MIGYYMTKSQVKSILSTFEVHFWAYVTFLGRFQTLCSGKNKKLFLPEKIYYLEISNFFYKSFGFTKVLSKNLRANFCYFHTVLLYILENLHVTKPGMPTSQSLQ